MLLKKNMDSTIGAQAQDCLDFAQNFNGEFEVIFEDERLTSRQAEYILRQTGTKYTKNKELVDIKSACIILQQYTGMFLFLQKLTPLAIPARK